MPHLLNPNAVIEAVTRDLRHDSRSGDLVIKRTGQIWVVEGIPFDLELDKVVGEIFTINFDRHYGVGIPADLDIRVSLF